ncbi:MAG: beta strand repeat-containing protein [Caulobacteraceae bacterium]
MSFSKIIAAILALLVATPAVAQVSAFRNNIFLPQYPLTSTDMSNFQAYITKTAGLISSVNGYTGTVVLKATDISGLGTAAFQPSTAFDPAGAAAAASGSATNASNITSGTLPAGRVSGTYSGITGVGSLSTGSVPTSLLNGILSCASHPALTGDVSTASGGCAATLATVNSSPGGFGNAASAVTATVDAKGRVTALSATPISIAASQVSGLGTLAAQSSLTQSQITTPLGFLPLNPYNNLGEITSATAALTNLGLGSNAAPAWAGLALTGAANSTLNIPLDVTTAGSLELFTFSDAGAAKWRLGKATNNSFFINDVANGIQALGISSAGVMTLGEGGQEVIPATGPVQFAACPLVSGTSICSNTGTGSYVAGSNISINGTTLAVNASPAFTNVSAGTITTTGAAALNSVNTAGLSVSGTSNLAGVTTTGYSQTSPASSGAYSFLNSGTSGYQALSVYEDAGSLKWEVGKNTDNSFQMLDVVNAKNAMSVSPAGQIVLGESGQLVIPASGPVTVGSLLAPNAAVLTSTGLLNTTLAAASCCTTNTMAFSGGGNFISFNPALSYVNSPTIDHQRTSALFSATTADDGHSEEQTLTVLTNINTGYAKTWAASSTFNGGDNINSSANAVYRESVSTCTSGTTSPAFAFRAGPYTDGTCTWVWINDSAINAKVGTYFETAVNPGGGSAWGYANNIHLQSGWNGGFAVASETDYSNNAKNCNIGATYCVAERFGLSGSFKSTSVIDITSGSVTNYQTIWGVRLSGNYLASDDDIQDDGGAATGLGFNNTGYGALGHSVSTILDASTSPTSYQANGTYSYAAFTSVNATTGAAFIAKAGQAVCFNGTLNCVTYNASAGKYVFTSNTGATIMSLTNAGTLTIAGPLIQNGTP